MDNLTRAQRLLRAAEGDYFDDLAEAEQFVADNRFLLADPTTELQVFDRLANETADRVVDAAETLKAAYDNKDIRAKDLHERRLAFEMLRDFSREITAEFTKRYEVQAEPPGEEEHNRPFLKWLFR